MVMGLKWGVILSLGFYFCCSITCDGVEGAFISRSNLFNDTTTRKTTFSKKHGVKSILSEDGDVIDCIDIYKQPAFKHPSLRNHTIQMTPTNVLKTKDTLKKGFEGTKEDNSAMTITSQRWHRSGSCPKGTIPIRRIQNGPKNRGKKSKRPTNSLANHSEAVVLTQGFSYSGAKVDIKVWTPYVEKEDEHTSSHVLVKNGDFDNFELVESGWIVNPSVYNDHQTRLFVYWTADGSNKTGCYDVTCPGFVQVNHEIALGAAIYPISKPNGLPYQITVYIYKDQVTNNWWVNYGESINIGYWPGELFVLLKYHGLMVKWGGEVYSTRVKTHPHTATHMGNGNTPSPIFEDCGTMKRMRVEQNSEPLMIPQWSNTIVDEYRCYDVLYEVDYVDDPIFYYGGPGRSPWCP